MTRSKFPLSQKGFARSGSAGFTLVELLIVIVIIGILAGVVIGVLNPLQQQNRARDAASRSALDKMVLSNKSLWSSGTRTTNRIPTEAEFLAGLSNVTSGVGDDCTNAVAGNTGSCLFAINSLPLPTDCGTANFTGTAGAQACRFFYKTDYSVAGFAEFQVAARGWANPVRLYIYAMRENLTTHNVDEGFYDCATTVNFSTNGTTPIGNTTNCNLIQ